MNNKPWKYNNLLKENTQKLYGYRSIGYGETVGLINNKQINGYFSFSQDDEWSTSRLENVICFFQEPYFWDSRKRGDKHAWFIQCEFDPDEVLETGTGKYLCNNAFVQTHIWNGRKGKNTLYIPELYVKSYNLSNVSAFISLDNNNDVFNGFCMDFKKEAYEVLKENNIKILNLSDLI